MKNDESITVYKKLAIRSINEMIEDNSLTELSGRSIEDILNWIDDDSLIDALLAANDIPV